MWGRDSTMEEPNLPVPYWFLSVWSDVGCMKKTAFLLWIILDSLTFSLNKHEQLLMVPSSLFCSVQISWPITDRWSKGRCRLVKVLPAGNTCVSLLSAPQGVSSLLGSLEERETLMTSSHSVLLHYGNKFSSWIRVLMIQTALNVWLPVKCILRIVQNRCWRTREGGHCMQMERDSSAEGPAGRIRASCLLKVTDSISAAACPRRTATHNAAGTQRLLHSNVDERWWQICPAHRGAIKNIHLNTPVFYRQQIKLKNSQLNMVSICSQNYSLFQLELKPLHVTVFVPSVEICIFSFTVSPAPQMMISSQQLQDQPVHHVACIWNNRQYRLKLDTLILIIQKLVYVMLVCLTWFYLDFFLFSPKIL